MSRLRIGALGAAGITPTSLLKPARQVPEVTVSAVAARDRDRARRYAARHSIPIAYGSYAELVADPDVDAVYVALPNSLHAEWTMAALEAGKHVLCEKPFTANAAEARRVADAAASSGLVVMEAFHYRYHPLVARILALLDGGAIGAVRHIETQLCFPLPKFNDIRYQLSLAGGATMDAGCYAIHFLRVLAGASGRESGNEPEVVSARARLQSAEIDRYMTAEFRCPNSVTGRVTTSMWSTHLLNISAQVIGDQGRLSVINYMLPHTYHRLTVRAAGRTHRERVPGEASYTYQLRAFANAVLHGGENLTPASDAVRTMSVIDDVYRAAGLLPRGSRIIGH